MIVTTKPVKQNKANAKDWPSEYTVNFLESGLVSYEDVGAGIAMLSKQTICKMLPTFVGKPVVINHVDVSPKDFENHAVGYVTKVWFDDYSGWAYCSFLLTDDKAKEKVAQGYSVSCAYDNVVTTKGGEFHAIKYDEEIIDGVFNHLALVTSPRYEKCVIQPCMMLVNSKKAVIKEGAGRKNTVTVKVKNKVQRICDTCEYLVMGKCEVAGPGGKITQRYADERILGRVQECSAYEKAKERKENFVTVRVLKNYSSGHTCDACGKSLAQDDYDAKGSWSYTCPGCEFRYKHGDKTAKEQMEKQGYQGK